MTDLDIYLSSPGFNFMAQQLGREIQSTITKTLNEESHNPSDNLAHNMHSSIAACGKRLANNPFYKRALLDDKYEIKDITYTDRLHNGVLYATMVVNNGYKYDTNKYGKPGYPGKYDGQLWQDELGTTYKWYEPSCQWYLLKDHPTHAGKVDQKEDSLESRFWNGAAFEPIYGNGHRAGNGDTFNSGRHGHPDDDLWGDPGFGKKPLSTWKGISGGDIKNFFHLTLNLKKIISLWGKFEDTFDKEEVEMENKTIPQEKMIGQDSQDTLKYRVTTIPHTKFKDQWFPYTGQVKAVRGYNNARKDSIYHANLSNDSFHYHITIEQLNNEK